MKESSFKGKEMPNDSWCKKKFNMQKLVTLFLGSGGTKLLRGAATENSGYSLTSAVPLYETTGVCAFSLFQFQPSKACYISTLLFFPSPASLSMTEKIQIQTR